MQRNAAGIDSKERDYVMKQHGPPESRQEKRYMDISVVPFTRPATSIFRDNLEKRKSQSFPEYKFEEKIDEKEPDRRGAHIINLELGNRNTPLQSKAISSVDQNKNRVFFQFEGICHFWHELRHAAYGYFNFESRFGCSSCPFSK
mmetsp:Transcript_1695/g.3168  ORF Transcript_1695/g.3168 Transcript_1695/m.3168 type:complete len:145 (-) Transcript_1695:516-950(-)